MIENEEQLKITRTWLKKFQRAREALTRAKHLRLSLPGESLFRASLDSQIQDLGLEIAAYKTKKSLEPSPLVLPPKLRNLPERKKKWLQGLTRQQRYQQIRIMQNLCAGCGKEPLAGKRLGEKCLAKQRKRMARTK